MDWKDCLFVFPEASTDQGYSTYHTGWLPRAEWAKIQDFGRARTLAYSPPNAVSSAVDPARGRS